MGKYNYDKSALKGLGVGDFLNEVKVREAHIAAAPASEIKSEYNANILAKKLHPDYQAVKISEIKDGPDSKTYTLVPDETKGTKSLAYFRAGQYLSVVVPMGESYICRPYTIASDPKDALGEENTSYKLTIKRTAKGFASDAALDNWKAGDSLIVSAPLGQFYYQDLRDAKHIIAVAGGSGITPFYAMAAAIASGAEDFRLTILYGSRTADSIILKEELAQAEAGSDGKVKVVHVLSDEEKEGYEHGFITAELIGKYADGDYSIFACGPYLMYDFLRKEVEKLGLPSRRARFEVPGEFGDPARDPEYPKEAAGKEYRLKVIVHGETTELTCRSDEAILDVCQKAGIPVSSDCRSGICGWCHSRLVEGDVFMPASADGRREADKKFGWIHPCAAYPVSDVTIEVFPSS
ncbi:MAG: iron-sulfur cluster-binding domain-containing protein [Lachnospiraceae bacterium]|nr:iron-sulfur cluster-binding domain-containing protein [Lachnospiraceae bacterium]